MNTKKNYCYSHLDFQFLFILGVQLNEKTVKKIGESFLSVSVGDEETLRTMKYFKDEFNFMLCPHSGKHILFIYSLLFLLFFLFLHH